MLPIKLGTEESKIMAIKIAVTGLKWFVGRQERGRVRSTFTTWVFKAMIRDIEQMLTGSILFDFDTVDASFVAMFEQANPGIVINKDGRLLQ